MWGFRVLICKRARLGVVKREERREIYGVQGPYDKYPWTIAQERKKRGRKSHMKAYMPWCSKYSNFYKDSFLSTNIYIRTLSCTNSISTLSLTSKLKTYVARTQHDMGLSNNAFLEKLRNDMAGIQQTIN